MKVVKLLTKISIFCFVLLEAVSSEAKFYKAAGGRKYLIETEAKYDWFTAFKYCKEEYYQFVMIDSEQENEAIIDLLTKTIKNPPNLWLGGHDDFGPGNNYNRPFFWSATGEEFEFNYWSDNNADVNENKAHCVHISNSTTEYQWNRADCTTKMGFICEVILKADLFS